MTTKIQKAVNKLSDKEKKIVKELIRQINKTDWEALNLKKVKTSKGIFRAKKGRIRILFCFVDKKLVIKKIERRTEKTYKNL